jgi:hypothetical protein
MFMQETRGIRKIKKIKKKNEAKFIVYFFNIFLFFFIFYKITNKSFLNDYRDCFPTQQMNAKAMGTFFYFTFFSFSFLLVN